MSSKKSASKRVFHKKVKKLTLGLTDGLTNILLYSIYVSAYMLAEGGKGPITVNRAFYKADALLAKFDAKKLRRALYTLKRSGLINDYQLPKITKMGMQRLNNIFPVYEEKRPWDKQLYLIIYDIPVKHNRYRDILREKLNNLHAVRIQNSVYLTPYNPTQILESLRKQKSIKGDVIISVLDPEKGFGRVKNIKEYLWDIYELENINERYEKFITYHSRLKKEDIKKQRLSIAFKYMSILKYDPQLPFELLPDSYLGDQAYLLFRKLTTQK